MSSDNIVGGSVAGTTELSITDCIIETDGCPCASTEIIKKIPEVIDISGAVEKKSEMLPDANTKEAKIIRKAATVLDCDSESCVLTNPEIKSAIGSDVINKEINVKFKEPGPRDSNTWLNNINIDKTLQKWAVEFNDLFVYPFCMSDFYKTHGSLATIKICDVFNGLISQKTANGTITRKCKRMCCVLNTDVSTGRGIHWVCLFVDCTTKPITIEYWNSAGNPPFASATKWMQQSRVELMKCTGENVNTISVTSVPHQESETECGVYVLFYIRKRLEGTPYQYFMDTRIPDSDMTEFRKYLFR